MMPKYDPEEDNVPYMEFYADLFLENVEDHKSAFISLAKLLTDDEIITSYVDKESKSRTSTSEPEGIDALINEAAKTWKRVMLGHALLTYNQQIVVIMVSVTESLIQMFFNCVFCRYPERMYDYILPKTIDNSLKGKVDLKEILQNTTRENLIRSLASRASEIAMQGKFQSNIKSLQSVTEDAFDEKILNKLIPLVEQRNRIVHELAREEDLTHNDVTAAFNNVIELVKETERVAIKLDIPVSRISKKEDL